MAEPPSPTPTIGAHQVVVVGADEQGEVAVDLDRWTGLAREVLLAEGVAGELTLTFVDRDEIAALNVEHMGTPGPTDVLSFPLDDGGAAATRRAGAARRRRRVPGRRRRPGRRPRRHARRRAGPARRARRAPRPRPRPRRAATRRRSCARGSSSSSSATTGPDRRRPASARSTSATKAAVDGGGDVHGQRRAPARHDHRPARAARPAGRRRDRHQPDQPAQGRGHRPRRPQARPGPAAARRGAGEVPQPGAADGQHPADRPGLPHHDPRSTGCSARWGLRRRLRAQRRRSSSCSPRRSPRRGPCCTAERAALATARPTLWLVRFWPLRAAHPAPDRPSPTGSCPARGSRRARSSPSRSCSASSRPPPRTR